MCASVRMRFWKVNEPFQPEIEPVPVTVRSGPVRYRSGFQTGRSPLDRQVAGRPVVTDRPVSCQSTGQTDRPAGPVRSDQLRPVPVVKNPDRFHLCVQPHPHPDLSIASD